MPDPTAACFFQPWVCETLASVHDSIAGTFVYRVIAGQSELFLLVPLVLLLERLFPAFPRQRLVSMGLVQDFVWGVIDLAFRATLIAGYFWLLGLFYHRYLNFLTIDSLRQWPEPALTVLAVVVTDFLGWFHHYLRHRIGWLWQFHAVHHAQRELNMFTDVRYHFMDYIVASTIAFIPLYSLGLDVPSAVGIGVLMSCYTKFTHANIKTDLGPLRYLMVTPQSHRVHHSRDEIHRDMNYGVIFSVWDRLFGTQYVDYRDYPATGITDPDYPEEKTIRGLALLTNPLAELIYPFRRVLGARATGGRR